jgi:CheY-like chemotaxis protein
MQRVLIVEDDAILRDFLVDTLELKGYSTAAVADGAAAVAYLKNESVDLVVSDVRMPEMDGVTLCLHLAQSEPGLPVVLISGAGPTDRDRFRKESGAWACLPKPLRVREFCQILTEAVA